VSGGSLVKYEACNNSNYSQTKIGHNFTGKCYFNNDISLSSTSNISLGGTSISINTTELSYLSGVTSNIQAQLDNRAKLSNANSFLGTNTFNGDITVLGVHNNFNNNIYFKNNIYFSGAGSKTLFQNGSELKFDNESKIEANGKIITPAQLSYLSGVTSSIQNQLNDKASVLSLTEKASLTGSNTFTANNIFNGSNTFNVTNTFTKDINFTNKTIYTGNITNTLGYVEDTFETLSATQTDITFDIEHPKNDPQFYGTYVSCGMLYLKNVSGSGRDIKFRLWTSPASYFNQASSQVHTVSSTSTISFNFSIILSKLLSNSRIKLRLGLDVNDPRHWEVQYTLHSIRIS
jgi:hypothetical protein